MRRTVLVLSLALVLTLAFTASAFATTGKFFKGGVDYYTWTNPTGSPSPGSAWIASGTSALGANAANPGVHANYLANTAKCGICHSVHRAAGAGTKLLPTADATCAGCHTGGTAITAKIITWGVSNMAWRAATPSPRARTAALARTTTLSTRCTATASGTASAPRRRPAISTDPFARYGCSTRRCHATNPHGANSSQYKIFSAKLLFNNSPADDDDEYPELVDRERQRHVRRRRRCL